MLKKSILIILFLALNLHAVWTNDSYAITQKAIDEEKRKYFSIAMQKPIGWDIEVGAVGNLLGAKDGKLNLFNLNTYGGWDVGYAYNFGYNIGEGIDVGSDGYSNPQLLTRSDFNIGAKSWLKFSGPGIWLDYWSTSNITIPEDSNLNKFAEAKEKWKCPENQKDHKICFDVFKLLGPKISINEEVSLPSIDYSLPFFNEDNPINFEFKNGIYDNDYSKTTYLDLDNLASKIPYPPVQIVSSIIDINLGVARGIDAHMDIALDNIKYTLKNGQIGTQTSLNSGFSVASNAGSDITLTSREYNIGIEPEIGVGLAIYSEVGILGYSVAIYYPLEGSNPPHLVKSTLKPKQLGYKDDRIILSASINIEKKYSVPSSSKQATLKDNVSLSVVSPSLISNGYVIGKNENGDTVIDCGIGNHTTCKATNLTAGSVISLIAHPNDGYTPSWYASCRKSKNNNNCKLKIDRNKAIDIKFKDMQAPTVYAPANIVKTALSVSSSVNIDLGQATAIDNVDGSIAVNNNAKTTSFKVGEYSVLWNAVDSSGNKGVAIQKIIIKAPDDAAFFKSETTPDNSSFLKGEKFTKSWTLYNVGKNTWDSNYCLVYHSGEYFGNKNKVCIKGTVPTGSEYTFSLDMTVPTSIGTKIGYWKLAKNNIKFSSSLWTKIKVKELEAPIWSILVPDKTQSTISLNWQGTNQSKYYRLYKSTSKYGTYIQEYIGQNSYYISTNLNANTTYYYKVKSCLNDNDENSCSNYSDITSVKTKNNGDTKPEPKLKESPKTNFIPIYKENEKKFKVVWKSNEVTNNINIEYSFDKSNWNTFATSTTKQSSLSKNIANAKSYNKIYFKITSSNDIASIENKIKELSYISKVDETTNDKEEPKSPKINYKTITTSKNNYKLYWKRVNDNKNQDNVKHYDVQISTSRNFEDATTIDAGNNAEGKNIYESASYTFTNLQDDTDYYLRVRAVNDIGTSKWSAYKIIKVRLEDKPYFTDYAYPKDNAIGITKLPRFDWHGIDKDGDDLKYYVQWGEDKNNLKYSNGWIEDDSYDLSANNEKSLKPNTKYYWQVMVREDGHYKDYYGGEYIKSTIRSFTTTSTGSDLAITNVELTSELKPDSKATFKITVKNIGSEISDDESIRAYYKKGGKIWDFRAKGWASMDKKLAPGESEIIDMTIAFDDRVLTYNGKTYDNILIQGDSYVIFDMPNLDENDVNPSNNRYEKLITYDNKGKPLFEQFYLVSIDNYNNKNGRYVRPNLGYEFGIHFSAKDDFRITKATIEYRVNENDSWHLITSINNPDEDMSESYYWNIPEDNNLITNTAQIRVKVYEDDTSYTEKISYPFPIESNLLELTLDNVSDHKVGDKFTLNMSLNNDYQIRLFNVKLISNGKTEELFNQFDSNGIDFNTFVDLELPSENRYASEKAYLQIRITDMAGNVKDIKSNEFKLNANTKLSSAFGNMIDVYNVQYTNFPSGSTNQSTNNKILQLEVDNNNIVHMIIESVASWLGDGDGDDAISRHFQYFYLTYDYNSKTISSKINIFDTKMINNGNLPSKSLKSFKMINGIPNVLVYDYEGQSDDITTNTITLYKYNGNNFTPQTIVTSNKIMDSIKFIENKDSIYVYYRELASNTYGGSVSDRRNKLKKIYPSQESEFNMADEYLGSAIRINNNYAYAPYDGNVYSLTDDLRVIEKVNTFSSTNHSDMIRNVDINSSYIDIFVDTNNKINLINNDYSKEYILDGNNSYRWDNYSYAKMNVKQIGDSIIFVSKIINPNNTNLESYSVKILDIKSKQVSEVVVGNRVDTYGANLITSVNDNKIVALGQLDEGSAYLAIGDLSKDIVEPMLKLENNETTIQNGKSIDLKWKASDNNDELVKYEIYKVTNGSESLLQTITNTQITSYNYTVNESNSDFIQFKIKAYDLSGNVSEDILGLKIVRPVVFNSFNINKTSINLGEKLIFSWNSDGTNSTKYDIYKKQVNDTKWTKVLTTTGNNPKSYIVNDFAGVYNFKIVSGNNELENSNSVEIIGEVLNFNNDLFTPQKYFNSNIIKFTWNDTLKTQIPYTIWIKKLDENNFSNIAEVYNKEYLYNSDLNDTFTWKVTAIFDNKQVSSDEFTVNLMKLDAPAINDINFSIINDTPTVKLSWSSIDNAKEYIVQRWLDNSVVNLITTNKTTFVDNSVKYGKVYKYTVLSKKDTLVSEPSISADINTSFDDKYNVIINNQNYQIIDTNSYKVSYVPNKSNINYESYMVKLGTDIANMEFYKETKDREVTFNNLQYATTYYVEVYPIDYMGNIISNLPAKLTFTTGFDNRELGGKAIVSIGDITDNQINLSWTSVTNADEYYICRSENNSKYNCFTSTKQTIFEDSINIQSNTKYSYVIVARNANAQTISDETKIITTPLKDEDRVLLDKNALVFELIRLKNIFEDNIVSRLNLINIGSNGSTITWNSTNESVLDTGSGIPNRISKNVSLSLTATIVYGNVTDTKQFNLIVLAKVDNSPISTTDDINIEKGTSLIAINAKASELPDTVQISWAIKDGVWSGYSKVNSLNNKIKSNGYSILTTVIDSEGLMVVAKENTTIKSTKNDTLTPTKTYPKGYSIHGTNNTIDTASITCKNNLTLGAALKLKADKWSIYMPDQIVPNMENFSYIYPNEGYMVWCYDESEY